MKKLSELYDLEKEIKLYHQDTNILINHEFVQSEKQQTETIATEDDPEYYRDLDCSIEVNGGQRIDITVRFEYDHSRDMVVFLIDDRNGVCYKGDHHDDVSAMISNWILTPLRIGEDHYA